MTHGNTNIKSNNVFYFVFKYSFIYYILRNLYAKPFYVSNDLALKKLTKGIIFSFVFGRFPVRVFDMTPTVPIQPCMMFISSQLVCK